MPRFTRRHPALLDMCLQVSTAPSEAADGIQWQSLTARARPQNMLDLVRAFEEERAELESQAEQQSSEDADAERSDGGGQGEGEAEAGGEGDDGGDDSSDGEESESDDTSPSSESSSGGGQAQSSSGGVAPSGQGQSSGDMHDSPPEGQEEDDSEAKEDGEPTEEVDGERQDEPTEDTSAEPGEGAEDDGPPADASEEDTGGADGGAPGASIPQWDQMLADQIRLDTDSSSDAGGGGDYMDRFNTPPPRSLDSVAEQLMENFKSKWSDQIEETDRASKMLRSLGGEGTDLDPNLTDTAGWSQLERLKPLLDSDHMRQFEELVRKLGRGGTRGRRRKALLQRSDPKGGRRVLQSPLVSEEISDGAICRSDELSRMLPSEAMLATSDVPALKLLFTARRAERALVTYEYAGWLELEARPKSRMASRPAGKGGPLLVCLDTSGSMGGQREAVSKAVAL